MKRLVSNQDDRITASSSEQKQEASSSEQKQEAETKVDPSEDETTYMHYRIVNNSLVKCFHPQNSIVPGCDFITDADHVPQTPDLDWYEYFLGDDEGANEVCEEEHYNQLGFLKCKLCNPKEYEQWEDY